MDCHTACQSIALSFLQMGPSKARPPENATGNTDTLFVFLICTNKTYSLLQEYNQTISYSDTERNFESSLQWEGIKLEQKWNRNGHFLVILALIFHCAVHIYMMIVCILATSGQYGYVGFKIHSFLADGMYVYPVYRLLSHLTQHICFSLYYCHILASM